MEFVRAKSCLFLTACIFCFATNVLAGCRDIRTYDFSNRIYEIRSGLLKSEPFQFRAKFKNGSYEEPHREDSLAFIYARIRSVRFGDLTNDGRDEAVIAVEYGSNSASFFLTNYFVFGCSAGRLRLIGSIEQDLLQALIPEMLHESLPEPAYISYGTLFIRHGVGGSRPSPDYVTTFRYRISKARLQRIGRPLYKRNRS
jgi:hypothetical protein